MEKPEYIKDFEQFIDRSINLKDMPTQYKSSMKPVDQIGEKLDVLERLIQFVRYFNSEKENRLEYTDFLKLNFGYYDDNQFRCIGVREETQFRKRKPSDYQLPLLIFLLINYPRPKQVLDTIKNFVSEIQHYLSPLDFETTKTGVLRCFTNTRFAAGTLRDWGLLRFAKEKGVRTWRLSFLGILVASVVYSPEWRKISIPDMSQGRLPRYWWDAISYVRDEGNLIKMLDDISSSNFFEKYATGKTAMEISEINKVIEEYLGVCQSRSTDKEKQKQMKCLIANIEKLPSIENFMSDFSSKYALNDFNSRMTFLMGGASA
jgi:hypothetical protein